MRLRYAALAGLFTLLVGFGFGRFYAPDKVVQTEAKKAEVLTVEVESQEAKQTIAYLRMQLELSKRHTYRTEVTVEDRKADTVTTTKTEDEHLEHSVDTRALGVAEMTAKVDVAKTQARKEESTSTEETTRERASVRIGATAGLDFASRAPAVGGKAEARLLGPFWLGLWGMSVGGHLVAGGSLALEF